MRNGRLPAVGPRVVLCLLAAFTLSLVTPMSADAVASGSRAFSNGHDEIVFNNPPPATATHYTVALSVPQPFPTYLPQEHLAAIVLDSRAPMVFLDFTNPETGTAVTLVGDMPHPRLRAPGGGRLSDLDINIPLENAVTGAAAGQFDYRLFEGRISSSGAEFEETAEINVLAGVLDSRDHHILEHFQRISLRRIHGSNPSSTRARASTFSGFTSQRLPLKLKLTNHGSLISDFSLKTPTHPCVGGRITVAEGTETGPVSSPVLPNGFFQVTSQETDYYVGSGRISGYTTVRLIGRFVSPHVASGFYFEIDHATEGPGAGEVCSSSGAFSLSG
jgi:hypothetical protein